MAVAVIVLVDNGLAATVAILIAVELSVLISLIPYGLIRRKSRYLGFPATLQGLQPTARAPDGPGTT